MRLEGERLTLGRDPTNDVVLADPNVSRFHAEVVRRDGRVELVDLGSRNGTRLDGELVERALLEPGSEVGIGPYRLTFDGTGSSPATSAALCGSTRAGLVVEVARSGSSTASRSRSSRASSSRSSARAARARAR